MTIPRTLQLFTFEQEWKIDQFTFIRWSNNLSQWPSSFQSPIFTSPFDHSIQFYLLFKRKYLPFRRMLKKNFKPRAATMRYDLTFKVLSDTAKMEMKYTGQFPCNENHLNYHVQKEGIYFFSVHNCLIYFSEK